MTGNEFANVMVNGRGAFHARDGLFFRREKNGDVTVAVTESAHTATPIVREVRLDAATWCSVVASMRRSGEDYESFTAAEAFHDN